jgi:photosystem II stability/assembly factor-like uncharacterized protein
MKGIVTIITFIICSTIGMAQWNTITPNPAKAQTLYSVTFIDASNGWAVGDDGTILKTTDSGASWSQIQAGLVHTSLKCVFFTGTTGWIVGGSGTILNYNGSSWSIVTSPTANTLHGVYFTDATHGWAVGDTGTVLSYNGSTWSSQTVGTAQLNSVFFTSSTTGWAVGNHDTVLQTIDGTNWTSQSISAAGDNLRSVYFTGASTGWAVSEGGFIWYTTNGTNWNSTRPTTLNLYGVSFYDADNGTAVGNNAIILRTINGSSGTGASWTAQNGPTTNFNLYSVYFSNADTLTAVGADTANSLILRTTNGGVLPIELTSFSASLVNNSVVLSWKTETEVNNYGFDVERSSANAGWQKIGFVDGSGNSNSPKNYSFTDNPSGGTSFSYRLKQIDVDGSFKYYDAVTINLSASSQPQLLQNSPNPFNPSTIIKFYIPNTSDVTIRIYDILGREVTTLINQQTTAGYHNVYWNGKNSRGENVSSGVYLYRLTAGSFSETKKMNLLK